MAFEVAEREPDPTRRQAWMTFVIVGGGPTGVELAGTLAEVSRQTLAKDFRHINTASARVILVEATPRVLVPTPRISPRRRGSSSSRLGVAVWTGTQVTGIDAEGVCIGSERVRRTPSSGPRGSPPRRWPGPSASRSTAPDASWSSPS